MLGFEHLFDGWHLLVLGLLGFFIFGPDRLPKAVSDGVRMLRNLRSMARNATNDLNRELGTDLRLEDLNPKAMLRKHLLSEEEELALRRPWDQLYRDVQDDLDSIKRRASSVAESVKSPSLGGASDDPTPSTGPRRVVFDADAT
jgi:sec-independent protein translocase protein TatB